MKHKPTGYVSNGEWIECRYDILNKECQQLVEDLVDSSLVSQRWSEELKYQYFVKAVSIAFNEGTSTKLSSFKQILNNVKHRFFVFVSRLVVYIP